MTAQEHVAAELRRQILNGELPGGSRLAQDEVAKRFMVSITPVREAFRVLAAEGLIAINPYRGATVSTPDLDEVREVYAIRALLEDYLTRRAVDMITEPELDRAAALLDEMEQEDDLGVWVELNRRFHGIVSEAARSPQAAQIVKGLQGKAAASVALHLQARPDRITVLNSEHRQLLDALRRRDADAASATIQQHMGSTLAVVERELDS